MRKCQRIIGMRLQNCGQPASVRVKRGGTWKYFCAECADYLAKRQAKGDKVKVEKLSEVETART